MGLFGDYFRSGWNPAAALPGWWKRYQEGEKAPQEEAARIAQESFQLQKSIFNWQKAQALKLEQLETSKEAKAAAEKQKKIEIGKAGRKSTILTGKGTLTNPATIKKKQLFASNSERTL